MTHRRKRMKKDDGDGFQNLKKILKLFKYKYEVL